MRSVRVTLSTVPGAGAEVVGNTVKKEVVGDTVKKEDVRQGEAEVP